MEHQQLRHQHHIRSHFRTSCFQHGSNHQHQPAQFRHPGYRDVKWTWRELFPLLGTHIRIDHRLHRLRHRCDRPLRRLALGRTSRQGTRSSPHLHRREIQLDQRNRIRNSLDKQNHANGFCSAMEPLSDEYQRESLDRTHHLPTYQNARSRRTDFAQCRHDRHHQPSPERNEGVQNSHGHQYRYIDPQGQRSCR